MIVQICDYVRFLESYSLRFYVRLWYEKGTTSRYVFCTIGYENFVRTWRSLYDLGYDIRGTILYDLTTVQLLMYVWYDKIFVVAPPLGETFSVDLNEVASPERVAEVRLTGLGLPLKSKTHRLKKPHVNAFPIHL